MDGRVWICVSTELLSILLNLYCLALNPNTYYSGIYKYLFSIRIDELLGFYFVNDLLSTI